MIDSEHEERLVLARARSALSPSLADRARVRRSLQSALALGTATQSAASSTSEASSALSGDSIWAGGELRKWLGRLLVPLVATLGGGVGYKLGYTAGVDDSRVHENASTPAATVESPAARPAPTEAPQASTPALPAAVPTAGALAQPKAPARQAAVAPSASPGIANDVGLDDEVRLLRRVEQALRSDNPRLAVGLLNELDRAVPRGQLVEERRAARVMAVCQIDGSGAASAEKYASEYPSSAYLARVREACANAPAREEPSATDLRGADTH